MAKNEELISKLLKFQPDLYNEIIEYQEEKHLPYFTTAVFELIRAGLRSSKGKEIKITPELLILVENSYKLFENDIKELHKYESEIERQIEEELKQKYNIEMNDNNERRSLE